MLEIIIMPLLTHSHSCLFKPMIMDIDHGDQLPNFILDRWRKLANKFMKRTTDVPIDNSL